jgi:hypothetical protein
MSVEIDVRCDECCKEISDSDACYCTDCYDKLKNVIDDFKERIEALERDLTDSENE